MAQSDLNVANLALRLLGNRSVLTALADATAEGYACTALLDDCKRSLLAMHKWGFATRRTNLIPTYSAITLVADNAGEFQITSAAHGLTTGDAITIHDATDFPTLNGTWVVTVDSASLMTLRNSTYVTGAGTAYGEWTLAAAFDYAYSHALPANYIRALEVNGDVPIDLYRVEENRLLIDDEEVRLKYIYDVTNYALMSPLFYQCLANYLAYNLCDHLTASDGKKNELHVYLYGGQGKRGILPQAKFVDSSEDAVQDVGASEWVASRWSGTGLNP